MTDIELEPENNGSHRFVRAMLQEAGIETLERQAFATRVPKLKVQMN